MELSSVHTPNEGGHLPEGWTLKPISQVAPLQRGFDLPTRDIEPGPFPIVYSNGIDGCHNIAMAKGPGVVTGRSGTLGKVHYVESDYWPHNTSLWVTRFNENDPKFIYYLYESLRFERFSSGSGVPTLNRNDAHSFSIGLPSDQVEQRAIAKALSDVDALLGGLDCLIAKKRDLKQAAMQQLLTGQTRLPGFQGEWEMTRLGRTGKCLRGVTYKGDEDLSAHDTATTKRLLRSNNVQSSTVLTNDVQYVNAARVSMHQILTPGDILICMANGSKALVGKSGRFAVDDGYEYTFGAFMGCFRTNAGVADSTFVFYLFQSGKYRNLVNDLLAGSSINNLKPSSIESLEFAFPSLPEQAAIATVINDMDGELSALEARREKSRALKQAMMQELLTGKTRLVRPGHAGVTTC